jgi:hypothetical protein
MTGDLEISKYAKNRVYGCQSLEENQPAIYESKENIAILSGELLYFIIELD